MEEDTQLDYLIQQQENNNNNNNTSESQEILKNIGKNSYDLINKQVGYDLWDTIVKGV